MLGNYIKVLTRILSKNKFYTFVNVLGLTIGFSACLILLQYVLFESSYDSSFPNSQNIYRVQLDSYKAGALEYRKAQVFPAVGPALKEDYNQVKDYARLFPIHELYDPQFVYKNSRGKIIRFQNQKVFAADPSFLSIFSFSFKGGTLAKTLDGPNKIIISETAATRYFPDEDPINRTITFEGFGEFLITGVFVDLPIKSHLEIEMIVSWLNVYEDRHRWTWDNFFTYILLAPDANRLALEGQLSTFVDNHIPERKRGTSNQIEFKFQPIRDIHLHSNLRGEMSINGDGKITNGLLIVSILILVVAVINYINLSTARSVKRGKEIAVRKVNGASTIRILFQFFTEALLLNLLSFILALGVTFFSLPIVQDLTGKNIDMDIWGTPAFLLTSTVIIILASILGAAYPTKVVARLEIIGALRGGYSTGNSKALIRKGLLTFQFVISIVLLGVTYIIHDQISYMKKYNLGFDISEKLILKTFIEPGEDSLFDASLSTFKTLVAPYAAIKNLSASSSIPGIENIWYMPAVLKNNNNEDRATTNTFITRVDENFFETYDIKLIAGRNFSVSEVAKKREIILNEAALEAFDLTNPESAIGSTVQMIGPRKVVGVVRNINDRSLMHPYVPTAFIAAPGPLKYITINLHTNAVKKDISVIKEKWNYAFRDTPFDYFFLDQKFNEQYRADLNLQQTFVIFTFLGVFIACLGLLGFTIFITTNRMKEISLRKVMGASNLNIVGLLAKEIILLLIIAGIIAVPLIFTVMEEWLFSYSFRIKLQAMHCIGPFIIVSAIALTSTIANLTRAALINPINFLGRE